MRHREIKKKERGGVIRIFLPAAQASDEMVKFLALVSTQCVRPLVADWRLP